MTLTEKQKTLLFYALEAMNKALYADEEDRPDFRNEDYFCHYRNEFDKLGNEAQLRELIDTTLSALC